MSDVNVPHEGQVGKAVDAQMRRTSSQVAIPNAAASVAAPTKAEFDALVGKFNLVLGVLRDAELICRRLQRACQFKDERGEVGEGNCRRYRRECGR